MAKKMYYVFWDTKNDQEAVKLSAGDQKKIGRILKAYELYRVIERRERFRKPRTVSVIWMGDSRI